MKKQVGYEDAFFVQIVDKETLKDILFVQTCIGILKKHIPNLCLVGTEVSKDKLSQVEGILKKLNNFAKCEDGKNSNDI